MEYALLGCPDGGGGAVEDLSLRGLRGTGGEWYMEWYTAVGEDDGCLCVGEDARECLGDARAFAMETATATSCGGSGSLFRGVRPLRMSLSWDLISRATKGGGRMC
jgi:hypothetical protein